MYPVLYHTPTQHLWINVERLQALILYIIGLTGILHKLLGLNTHACFKLAAIASIELSIWR